MTGVSMKSLREEETLSEDMTSVISTGETSNKVVGTDPQYGGSFKLHLKLEFTRAVATFCLMLSIFAVKKIRECSAEPRVI